ncbi:MAG: helix-turn-helix domain-containing protein [Alphaproteobacteria bacterium]|nr:helix-turn-helix domain-containing protein [Alphaproteobacteria bacterium]
MEQQIGPRLRKIRKRCGYTLEELASKTGLTKGYLSKIETSKKVPPIATLSRLSEAVGCEIAYFFQDHEGANRVEDRISVVRAEERRLVVRGGSSFGYDYRSLAHGYSDKSMNPFVFTFPADVQGDTFFEHDGEELIFILGGAVEFEIAEKRLRLQTGDSVYFDSSLPHRGRSIGDENAQALVVIYGQANMRRR